MDREEMKKSEFLKGAVRPVQDFDENGEPSEAVVNRFVPLVQAYLSLLGSQEREASNEAVKSICKYVYDLKYRAEHDEEIKWCFDQVMPHAGGRGSAAAPRDADGGASGGLHKD